MLKFGVVRRAQLSRPYSWLGRKKLASLLLLQELFETPGCCEEHYDIVLRLRTSNGTWSETGKGRLAVIDAALLDVLATRRASGTPLSVFDISVANGVTSVDLYHALRSVFDVQFVAADRQGHAFAVTCADLSRRRAARLH